MKVGNNIKSNVGGWNFGDSVPETFVDHAKLSIPMYEEGHELISELSDFFVRDQSLIYEIGVSTGELIRKLSKRNEQKKAL